MQTIQQLHFALNSLCLYRHLLEDETIAQLSQLLSGDFASAHQAGAAYGRFYSLLSGPSGAPSLSEAVLDRVHQADNLFTRLCAAGQLQELPPHLKEAVQRDLDTLSMLAGLSCAQLKEHLQQRFPDYADSISALPEYPAGQAADQIKDMPGLAAYHNKNGYGIFAKHRAFTLDLDMSRGLRLAPVQHPDDICLSQLKGYTTERELIIDNTLSLLAHKPANNILLYGDRGTGKSSTVKAILNEYAPQGLRLVEIPKHHLPYLGQVIGLLANSPLKFILFADDLSFSDSDDSYTALKAVLEGSVSKLPDNMVIYATSNRRHLVRETFSSREGDEVHLADTRDEAASLADRFGITVTFISPDKQRFLEMVTAIAADRGLKVDAEILSASANRWAARRGSFSPRTASQFVDWACSRIERGLTL